MMLKDKLNVKESGKDAVSTIFIGSWKYIQTSHSFTLDPVLSTLLGLVKTKEVPFNQFLEYLDAEDRNPFSDHISNLIQSDCITSFNMDLRLSLSDRQQNVRAAATSFLDEQGNIEGIAGALLKIPDKFHLRRNDNAVDELKFRNPDLVTRWDKDLRLLFANPAFESQVGVALSELLGKTNQEMGNTGQVAIPYTETLRRVFERGLAAEQYNYCASVNGGIYYQSQITPEFDENGRIESVLSVARDISDLKEKKNIWADREQSFNDLVHQAPVATCLFTGPDMVIEIANDLMLGFWGKDRSVIGQPLGQAVPELVGQPLLEILDGVFKTGQAYEQKSAAAKLRVNGQLSTFYFDITYKPLLNSNGQVYGIIDMAVDVTAQTIHFQNLQASENRFRSMIASAPAAVGLFIGPELIIESPNQGFIEVIGRGSDIAGKKLAELMPELEKQNFIELLGQVYHTGEPFYASEAPLDLLIDGTLHRRYFNVSFTPLRDSQGDIYGILDISIDVTRAVEAGKKISHAEASLRNVVEMAELGIWTADRRKRTIELSPRLKQWYGLDENSEVSLDQIISMVDHRDFTASALLLKKLNLAGSEFSPYDTRYRITAADGVRRTLRDQGQVWFDSQGNVSTITGAVQDITDQVRHTDGLQDKINFAEGELGESNRDLKRSDANMLQFAYVASHDLQEPLRKIQTFAGLLKTQYHQQLGQGKMHVERIEQAAQRMSDLVRDLLQFSEISTTRQKADLIDLNQVMGQVLDDLELKIKQDRARITIGKLPTVKGNYSQLNQLFNNLISNALKFHQPDQSPVIDIRCETISSLQIPIQISENRLSDYYYHIEIIDQGIGFAQDHAERIFQVFQRLHSKAEFAGTGIGLAICEKVAANHGGAIRATSSPGLGSTFSVYLPA